MNCERCGSELKDGGMFGLFCPDKECTIEEMRDIYRHITEQKEREELARLKAKYDTPSTN